MKIELWELGRVRPYDKNPRQNDQAVEAVAQLTRADEVWRPVPGYEGAYEVSNYGRLRRSIPSRMAPAGYVLRPRLTRHGYLAYALSRHRRYWHVTAHRLVALAFLGPPPFTGAHVAHGDGNKLNNHVSNLRWATRQENEADKQRHGTARGAHRGEQHHAAKLTEAMVKEMRRLAASGMRFKVVARRLGVAPGTAYDAIVGKTWKAISNPAPVPQPRRVA